MGFLSSGRPVGQTSLSTLDGWGWSWRSRTSILNCLEGWGAMEASTWSFALIVFNLPLVCKNPDGVCSPVLGTGVRNGEEKWWKFGGGVAEKRRVPRALVRRTGLWGGVSSSFLDEVSSMFTPRRNWITPPQTFQLRAIKSLSSANCRLAEPHITNLVIMPAAACLAVPCALQERCAWLGWMGSVCLFGNQTWVLGRCVERRAVWESRGWRCPWEGSRCAGNRLSATV